jgi:hypothetical protein
MKYNLELTEKQAQTIINALDLVGRLELGQIKEIVNPWTSPLSITPSDKIDVLIKELKKELFPELDENAYYSIYNKEHVSDSARIGYDLIQVIRHSIAYTNNPEGGITVDFNKPRKTSETEELAKIKVFK